jgi:hypothetical protein
LALFSTPAVAVSSTVGKLDPLQQSALSDAVRVTIAGQQNVTSPAMSTAAGTTGCQTYARILDDPTI